MLKQEFDEEKEQYKKIIESLSQKVNDLNCQNKMQIELYKQVREGLPEDGVKCKEKIQDLDKQIYVMHAKYDMAEQAQLEQAL